MSSSRWKLVAAYVSVYLSWGSTYLAIRIGVNRFSPAATMGLRFVLGALMMLVLRSALTRKKSARASAGQIARAAAIGCLMLAGGTGLLAYAEVTVPSGICSLVVGCAPIVFALLNRVAGGSALTRNQIAGGLLGLTGLVALTLGGSSSGDGAAPIMGLATVLSGMLCWVSASVAAQHVSMPEDHYLTTTIEMFAAGVLLLVIGWARAEYQLADLLHVPRPTLLAIVYLASIGSCLGFTAYSWLLRREPANRVSSYAFVNPVVAVFLGVFFAGEPFTAPIAAAVALTLGGVSLSLFGGRLTRSALPRTEPEA